MPKWTDEELRQLEEDEDQWDWEHGELMEPAPPDKRGAVVMVRFTQAEFQRIGAAARQADTSLITYIHDAAVKRAAREPKAPQPAHAPRSKQAKP
jgi:hypothetical protein